MADHKRLTNCIIGLLNKVNKKVKMIEIDDYVSKLRLLANNSQPADLDFIVDGIVCFASKNLNAIKQKKIEDIEYKDFDILSHYDANIDKFNKEEQEDVWTRINTIIGISAKIVGDR